MIPSCKNSLLRGGFLSPLSKALGRTIVVAAVVSVPLPTGAGTMNVPIGAGPRVSKQVVSLREARFKNIVSQRLDFSCGAAALATLLKYHFGKEVTEADVIKGMFTRGDQKLIKQKGFSLLDMKRYAEAIGYRANGYRLELDNLTKVDIPTIVLIDFLGYSHFVVLKGLMGDKVFLADPALGNRAISLDDFSRYWNSVIFVVEGSREGNPVGLNVVDAICRARKGGLLRLKDTAIGNFAINSAQAMYINTGYTSVISTTDVMGIGGK